VEVKKVKASKTMDPISTSH